MANEKVDEIFQFKISGIVDFPIEGIIVGKIMDFDKNETKVTVRLAYEEIETCPKKSE